MHISFTLSIITLYHSSVMYSVIISSLGTKSVTFRYPNSYGTLHRVLLLRV